MLDRRTADEPGVVTRAAAHDEDLVDAAEVFVGEICLVEHDGSGVDPTEQRVAHGIGLLVNLLQHEVGVAPFFRGREIPRDFAPLGRYFLTEQRGDPHRPGAKFHDAFVVDHEELLGLAVNRGDVRREVRGRVVSAADQRRPPTGADDHVGLVGVHDADRELAVHFA